MIDTEKHGQAAGTTLKVFGLVLVAALVICETIVLLNA